MKKIFIGISLIFLSVMIFFANKSDRQANQKKDNSSGANENRSERVKWELNRLKDPVSGRIPRGIFQAELEYAKGLPSDASLMQKDINWTARGPYNVGGRTRGADIDINNENIIIAGGVSGGVWKTINAGISWNKVTPSDQLHNVTTMAQDKRAGHTQNWYFGTGEYYGNSAGAYGADFIGNGLYKSTDNGNNWFSLVSTASNTPEQMDSLWDYTWRLAIDRSNLTEDEIYAAVYRGLYRSTNGGQTWKKALAGGLGSSAIFTDVAVSSQGIVYAAINSGGIKKVLWRSTDGITWTNITPVAFPTSLRRIVIGINPSNENEVYFFANTPGQGQPSVNFSNSTEYTSLFKYQYISGDGAGVNGNWTNLSQNLPNNGSTNFDNLFVQDSYNMVVAVKPDEPNTVFLGGTNLYRSTDGFTSPNNTKQIGGYRIGSYFPNWGVYKNHHPDQHGLIFLPSNPSTLITFNDGGLYKTLNCNAADSVVWQSLNNGYRNSQVYAVMANNATTDDKLLAGFQDNGNYFTPSANITAPWIMPLNGDGAFSTVSNDGSYYCISIQQGKMYKMALNNDGTPNAFTRIDPVGGTGYSFINPFLLDPNDDNILYMPEGKNLWRYNGVSQIPYTGSHDQMGTGWFKLTQTAGSTIVAIAASVVPAHIVYVSDIYGSTYRIDSADSGDPVFTNISNYSHTNYYTSCLAVDPRNAEKLALVFSNYRVYSILYSETGGQTWMKVAGNLEQYPDGTGNGPSCRWISILPVGKKTLYLASTSVGLFATDTLIDNATVWTNIGVNTIGNVVISMTHTRPLDGLVVVATHGNGIYSTKITAIDDIISSLKNRSVFANAPVLFPNPVKETSNLRLNLSKIADIKIKLIDITGKIINEISTKNSPAGEINIPINCNSLTSGKYFCTIECGGTSKVLPFVKIQ